MVQLGHDSHYVCSIRNYNIRETLYLEEDKVTRHVLRKLKKEEAIDEQSVPCNIG